MNKEWLVSPEDDLLKILDINESPNNDQGFKELMNAMMQSEFVEDIDPYVAEDDTRTEIVASPYSLLEAAEAATNENIVEEAKEAAEAFVAKLKSLVEFCEENDINYVRFSIWFLILILRSNSWGV